MRKLLLVLAAIPFLTGVKPLSFDETQRRYLNPNEIIGLYKSAFPTWDYSYCQYLGFGGDDILDLLGQNRPILGAPIDAVPSSALVARLRECISRAVNWEDRAFDREPTLPPDYRAGVQAKLRDLRRFICLGEDCANGSGWHYVRLSDLTDEDQELFVVETLRTLWGDPGIYEDLNPGSSFPNLVAKIRAQLAGAQLFEAYTQIQLWAALRDEFLLF